MKRFKSMCIIAIAIVIGVVYASPAPPVSAAASASLSIVPKKNYTIEPGKTVKDTLTIRNLDPNETLELSLRVVDFTFTDDGGAPKLMLAEDAPQTTWSLKPFLTVPKKVTIEPKKSKTLDMSVAIPAGHGAGSYYSAIVYSSGAADGGNVGLSASGVTLAFVQIPGKVKEDLKLEKFGAYAPATQNSKAGYMFITADEPKNMAFTVKNSGNVTEAPVGSITLKDIFGREQTINNVNPNGSLALIGQSRTFVSCIKLKVEDVNFNGTRTSSKVCDSPGLLPGVYTAELNVFYGQNGNNTQEINSSAVFWYLPWWFLLILAIILSIIGYFVVRIMRAMRGSSGRRKKTARRK